MIYENFSEKQILEDLSRNNHLGQGIERLSLKIVRCTANFFNPKGMLIYRHGKEYKLWIVKYSDVLLGVTKWFTAEPKMFHQTSPEAQMPHPTFYMVPLEVFQYAGESPQAVGFEFSPGKRLFQLFVDANDGMRCLVDAECLEKSAVIDYAVQVKGGSPLDYTIRGRLVRNRKECHIVWLLQRKMGKRQTETYFFDVMTKKFIDWNTNQPDAIMAPISSGQAMVRVWGNNTVRADKYRMYYKLGK